MLQEFMQYAKQAYRESSMPYFLNYSTSQTHGESWQNSILSNELPEKLKELGYNLTPEPYEDGKRMVKQPILNTQGYGEIPEELLEQLGEIKRNPLLIPVEEEVYNKIKNHEQNFDFFTTEDDFQVGDIVNYAKDDDAFLEGKWIERKINSIAQITFGIDGYYENLLIVSYETELESGVGDAALTGTVEPTLFCYLEKRAFHWFFSEEVKDISVGDLIEFKCMGDTLVRKVKMVTPVPEDKDFTIVGF